MVMTFRIIQADCIEAMQAMDAASVQTVVTSPPYWGLRDYGEPGQLGLEPTPEAYVERMVEVFREVRRVLRDDGTVWLNLGDSYASNPASGGPGQQEGGEHQRTPRNGYVRPLGLKPKDLVGIPWRVAFALQADGWYLRSDIIWAKPNPMPESVTDRPTKSHEYIFLLSKSARYYFDADAVREPNVSPEQAEHNARYAKVYDVHTERVVVRGEGVQPGNVNNVGIHARGGATVGRNIRSVWNIATEPFPDAHFATFPKKLVEPCVKAGTSEKGCCAECGAPWVRITQRDVEFTSGSGAAGNPPNGKNGNDYEQATSGDYDVRMGPAVKIMTTGWKSGCDHVGEPVPCVVMDPFCGSGTTGVVAMRLGRSFVGIELNPAYAEMARNRIFDDGPLFNVEDDESFPNHRGRDGNRRETGCVEHSSQAS